MDKMSTIDTMDTIEESCENINLVDYLKKRKNINTIFSPQLEVFMPFAQMVDNSRGNMAAKQQTQPVVSKNTETPLAIDKYYQKISSVVSPFMEIAEDDGVVLYNDNNILIFYYKNLKKVITRQVAPSKKLISYSLDLKYIIPDNVFKKGDVLFDYTNINPENKMPKIGYRANILFTHFMGYTADDAIVASESFANKTLFYKSEKYYLPIVKTWKYFRIERGNEVDTY